MSGLASWTSDARAGRFWDTLTWSELRLPADWPGTGIRWGAVSSDNRIVAALDSSGTVAWWDIASGRRLARFEHHFAGLDGYLSFSPDGPLLAGSAKDGMTTIWNIATGQSDSIRGNFRAVHGVAFSSDGQRLLSGGQDPSDVVRLLDLGSLRHVATLAGPPGYADEFWFIEMTADGNTLVAVGMQKTALIWPAPSWAEIEATERAKTARR